MNSLEFHRALLEDPYQNNPDLLEHEADCAECAAYSRKIRAQESALRALLNTPAPPPELAENIRLGIQMEQRANTGRRVWLAAAASVLLLVGASMFALFTERHQREHLAPAQNVIYHIEDEARHLRDPGPASPARVHAVLARFGAELSDNIGQIRFAAECVMRNRTGVHLILSGKQGSVTVFFMPEERTPEVVHVDSGRFHGEIVPTTWGAVAVVGEQGEPIVTRAMHAVRWPVGTPGFAAVPPAGNERVVQVEL